MNLDVSSCTRGMSLIVRNIAKRLRTNSTGIGIGGVGGDRLLSSSVICSQTEQ